MSHPHLAILGAGPTGLEAALAAADAGLSFTLYEAADEVAANVRRWGHVRLFTPWSLDVSPRARAHLRRAGIEPPGGQGCPTGRELVEGLLQPLAELPWIAPRLELGTTVVQLGREGFLKNEEIGTGRRAGTPFRILLRDRDGRERVARADVVLDCTGTYQHPNPLGAGGIRAPGESAAEPFIVRSIPDVLGAREAWAGRRVLLVGAGHSAQTAARDLAALAGEKPGTSVVWAIRSAEPDFGAVADDPLPERAALVAAARRIARGEVAGIDVRTGVSVDSLRVGDEGVSVALRGSGGQERVVVDRVVALTGSVGDASVYRELQVHECWATSGPMKLAAALLGAGSADCLEQTSPGAETLRNPEPDFYVLGAKSYGRNNTFLLRVGWEQVDDVFGLFAPSAAEEAGGVGAGAGGTARAVTGSGGTASGDAA